MDPRLLEAVRAAFPDNPATITLGAPMQGAECEPEPLVYLSRRMLLRHALVAGSPATGRARTVQLATEQLSAAGVSVLVADPRGELTGLAAPGAPTEAVRERTEQTGYTWKPSACPVELASPTGKLGAHLRATPSSLGPTLTARVIGATPAQSAALGVAFRYADAKRMPLVDLDDVRALVESLATDEGQRDLAPFGAPTRVTLGAVARRIGEARASGVAAMFGEPEFDVGDLLRTPGGRGLVTVLSLADLASQPVAYATLMLWMLARLYHELPDAGDLEQPRLVFFFADAHRLLDGASRALTEQVLQLVRVVRSRGIGIVFEAPSPRELPAELVAQLGSKIQHAIVAGEPEGDKALRSAVRALPRSEFYDLERVLAELAPGEAVVSALSPSGAPTLPVVTRMVPPSSRMGPLTERELTTRIHESTQVKRYGLRIERDAAREMLGRKMLAGHAAARATAPEERSPRQSGLFEKSQEPPAVGRGLLGAMLGPQARRRRG